MILIDADILVYRAIASVEREVEFEPDVWIMSTDLRDARDAFNEMLDPLVRELGSNYLLCFSDRENFRKEIDPTYKGNRVGTRKPMGFKVFREEIIEKHRGLSKPSLEADDLIGILATKHIAKEPIIVSGDKDLMQIPGKHWVKGEIVEVSPEEGEFLHMMQTLTGDTADGYPGCPGVGPKTAEKILAHGPYWPFVVAAYSKAGLTEEDALRQARLARILQVEDWNEEERKPILWNPPN